MLQNYDIIVKKFKNLIMRRGKASLAEYMFLKALSKIKKITLKNPFYILKKAIYNTSPVLFYIEFKKGKRIFRLPSKISQSKALFYGIKWIIDSAKQRSEHGFSNQLCLELIDTANGSSNSIKKKDALYKILIDHRPFVNYKNYKGTRIRTYRR